MQTDAGQATWPPGRTRALQRSSHGLQRLLARDGFPGTLSPHPDEPRIRSDDLRPGRAPADRVLREGGVRRALRRQPARLGAAPVPARPRLAPLHRSAPERAVALRGARPLAREDLRHRRRCPLAMGRPGQERRARRARSAPHRVASAARRGQLAARGLPLARRPLRARACAVPRRSPERRPQAGGRAVARDAPRDALPLPHEAREGRPRGCLARGAGARSAPARRHRDGRQRGLILLEKAQSFEQERTFGMGGLRMGELIVILLIVVILFGANRIPQLGKGLGEGIRSFKKAFSGDEEEKPSSTASRTSSADSTPTTVPSLDTTATRSVRCSAMSAAARESGAVSATDRATRAIASPTFAPGRARSRSASPTTPTGLPSPSTTGADPWWRARSASAATDRETPGRSATAAAR